MASIAPLLSIASTIVLVGGVYAVRGRRSHMGRLALARPESEKGEGLHFDRMPLAAPPPGFQLLE